MQGTFSAMFISVVITAYNRKEYLANAVRSVLNQDINSNNFEILIIKNFKEQFVDSLKQHTNIQIINTDDSTLGQYYSLALKFSKGDVLSFLDDDDLFTSDKLSRLENIFKDHPSLIYYRNSSLTSKGSIQELSISDYKGRVYYKKTRFYSSMEVIEKGIRSLQWNMSCITVRKNILLGYEEAISRIIGAPDLTIFYIAATHKGHFCLDQSVLTIRNINSNSAMSHLGKDNDFVRESKSLDSILLYINQKDLLRDLEKTKIRIRMLSALMGSEIDDKELRDLLLRYLKLGILNINDFKAVLFLYYLNGMRLILNCRHFRVTGMIYRLIRDLFI